MEKLKRFHGLAAANGGAKVSVDQLVRSQDREATLVRPSLRNAPSSPPSPFFVGSSTCSSARLETRLPACLLPLC